MDILIIIFFGGAIAFLWNRLDKLERRVGDLTDELVGLRYTQLDQIEEMRRGSGEPVPDSAADLVAEDPAVEPATRLESEEQPAPEVEPVTPEPGPEPEAIPEETQATAPAMAYAGRVDEHIAEDVEPRPRFTFDFEDIFGRRLPIWAGGFALAIAGIFLVRFAIEAGLLTPSVRVALSFVFGLGLLGGAEAAYRMEHRLRDPRVRQALSGAGLATLYGAFYLAGTGYGLIGAGAAFAGLAVVTAAAIALSFRFGLPSAIIGLVGGFAAPLMVDSDSSNVPLLTFYLALISGGLAWSGQVQGRGWLGYVALAAGLAWGVLMMLAGVSSTSDLAALGLYLIVLGTALPAFLHANGGPSLPKLAAGAIATLQMAVLVSDAGFAPLTWGLYLLIGAALAGLGWRYPNLRLSTLVAAGLGVWLLLIWDDPSPTSFGLVAVCQMAIFAIVPLAYHWFEKAKTLDLAQLSGVAFALGIATYAQFGTWGDLPSEPGLAASLAGLALLPAAAFALLWKRGQEGETRNALILLGPAALLLFAALLLLSDAWLAPVMATIVASGLLLLHRQRAALSLQCAVWTSAGIAILALVVTPNFEEEIFRLGTSDVDLGVFRPALRWIATALPSLGIALISRDVISRRIGEGLAVAILYGAIAQAAPSESLAWIAGVATIALFHFQPARHAAWATALGITILWAVEPVGLWFMAGGGALVSAPFLSESAIGNLDLALRIAPLLAALGVLAWRLDTQRIDARAITFFSLGLVVMIALHSLYKQIWNISSMLRFEHYGMAERTIWQAALVLAAYGAREYLPATLRKPVSLSFLAMSLAHFVWFTLVLHNPLFLVQYVGPTPIANWLTLAYVSAIAGLWLAMSQWDEPSKLGRRSADIATMLLISLLAYSLLRQMFAGSVLTSRSIEQTESLLISLLGILLALAFLWWGSWRKTRTWRIGSLVLMLAAVIKVFLLDAAVLDGLLRIASFMALGFSLIGIGWVYSRQLARGEGAQTSEKEAELTPP